MDFEKNPLYKCFFLKSLCETVFDLHNDLVTHENSLKNCQSCLENSPTLSLIKNHLFSIVKINLCLKNDEEFVEYLDEVDRGMDTLPSINYGEDHLIDGVKKKEEKEDISFPVIPEVEFDAAFMDEDSCDSSSSASSRKDVPGDEEIQKPEEEEADEISYECYICQAKISNKPELIEHMEEIHIKKRAKKDPPETLDASNPENDDEDENMEVGQVVSARLHRNFCVLCKQSYYRRHQCTFGPDNFDCKFCPEFFNSYIHLCDHHKEYHPKDPVPESPYKCHFCGKTTKRPNLLISHMRIHAGVPRYKCEICGEGFHVMQKKHQHMYEHVPEDEKLTCEVCNKTFVFADTLRNHVKTVHPHHKQLQFFYRCKICGFPFKSVTGLRKHKQSTHVATEDPLVYKCIICGRRFPTNWKLNRHRARKHRDKIEIKLRLRPKEDKSEGRKKQESSSVPAAAAAQKRNKPNFRSPTRASPRSYSTSKNNVRNGVKLRIGLRSSK